MSLLKSQPYLPSEGTEFVGYMTRVSDGVTELKREGRVPDDPGVDKLLKLWRDITAQMKSDIRAAGPDAAHPITTAIPMTAAEHKQNMAMFETFYQLMRILEMRGALDLTRSDGVTRVVVAFMNGTIT